MTRIERCLTEALSLTHGPAAPPSLIAAMRYAVLPGGARIRPRLSLAVALACGDDEPGLADAAAASIELLHCASLVHDDLPSFDDAPLRRGKPTVHAAYGEQVALLTGDALIVLAFQALAQAAGRSPAATLRLPALVGLIAAAVGAPDGITAGQAWESERDVALATYQQAKTGALFAAATAAGACAAGQAPQPWLALGARLGEAYQVADDLRDVVASSAELGKPTGRDLALGRPNAVHRLGLNAALQHLQALVGAALAAIPPCAGADALAAHIRAEAGRLVPRELARPAA
jgi:geranylgeranyl diphosphate synthase type II